jgi:hypothetical protein
MALLHFRKKSCYRFLLPLKFHRSQPGLKPRNLSLMASTLSITPPKTTTYKVTTELTSQGNFYTATAVALGYESCGFKTQTDVYILRRVMMA